MRIVSLCPSNTEMLAYLGLLDSIVATDNYSDWPIGVQSLPKVGPDLSIDMDKVAELKPDLVVASLSVPGMEKNIERLKERDLPYIVSNPHSLTDIRNELFLFGEATHTMEKAHELASLFDSIINQYEHIASQCSPISVYWEWWPKPIFSPGGGNWLTEITRLAGGRNVLSHYDESSIKLDWHDIQDLDPDFICLSWVGVQTKKMRPEVLKKRPGWEQIKAIKHNQMAIMEESLYCRPSLRLLKGLKKAAVLFHPETFPSYDDSDPLLPKQ